MPEEPCAEWFPVFQILLAIHPMQLHACVDMVRVFVAITIQ